VDFSGESWLEQGLTQAPPQDYQLLGNIQYDLAGYDFMTAQYPQSLAHLQASRNYKQEYLPRLDVEMGKCYDFLGLLQSNLEAYAEALNSFQLAASIYAQDSTPEYRRLQTDLIHKWANCYYRMGQYAKAEQLYAKALAGWQEIGGPGNKIAAAYSGLGNVNDEWQDYEQALAWYVRGAEAGNAVGMANAALLYENGRGTAENVDEAFRWYAQAAEAGNVQSMASLGFFYSNGMGTEIDDAQALLWYGRAADLGNTIAGDIDSSPIEQPLQCRVGEYSSRAMPVHRARDTLARGRREPLIPWRDQKRAVVAAERRTTTERQALCARRRRLGPREQAHGRVSSVI